MIDQLGFSDTVKIYLKLKGCLGMPFGKWEWKGAGLRYIYVGIWYPHTMEREKKISAQMPGKKRMLSVQNFSSYCKFLGRQMFPVTMTQISVNQYSLWGSEEVSIFQRWKVLKVWGWLEPNFSSGYFFFLNKKKPGWFCNVRYSWITENHLPERSAHLK